MKTALICYHSGARTRYPATWLDQYRQSIDAQCLGVDILELDYGGGDTRLFERSAWGSTVLPTHVHAQNLLLDAAFEAGYDAVCNSNIDDVYAPEYTSLSVASLARGAALASSNFDLMGADGVVFHHHTDFHLANLASELAADRNPICHPTVAYSRAFWTGCSRYDPAEIPCEDMRLWQREINRFPFAVEREVLVRHRVHDASVCAVEARKR